VNATVVMADVAAKHSGDSLEEPNHWLLFVEAGEVAMGGSGVSIHLGRDAAKVEERLEQIEQAIDEVRRRMAAVDKNRLAA